jgi:phage shock protein A
MGIFARLATLIKSNLNDLISRSEDPEKMLNQVVIDMANQLIEAKKQVAVSIADEKRLAKQAEQEAANAAEWERRAMLAIKAGDDNLAKEALNRKKEHETLANTLKDQWQKQKQAVEQLKTALRLLNNKIEEAKRKKNVLIARKKRAEAQKAIQETMSGISNASAFETFDRMAQKIDQIEAEAEASTEIAEQYTGDNLAEKFGKLEQSAGADDDLVALKRKMGVLPPEPPKEEKQPIRVAQQAPAAPVSTPGAQPSQAEQDELAAALAELEAQEQQEQARMKR